MKRTLLFSILVTLTIITLSGCGRPYINTWTDPNGTYHAHMGTYRQSRSAKLLAHRYGDVWYNIGLEDSTDTKKPFILRSTDQQFMVEVGHPKKFIGSVISVQVWLDDTGPIDAQGQSDGKYYFSVRTRSSWATGLWPRFDGLTPGPHMITVRIAWQHTRGPYEGGPVSEDYIEYIEGWIDFDSWYIK